MAKKLNVELAFNADTSKAKAQIQELFVILNKIGSAGIGSTSNDLKQSAEAAQQLSYHLNKAFNAQTGNLDLGKFNASLSKSNTDINKLSTSLLKAGSQGKEAFNNLAQSIANADYPMVRINSHITEFFTTLKNTARWQISSSILHGFMGALSQAYGYAQDLNQSLNNIRIVTGYSAEQMAEFAVQANKSAQALSTTTTKYTDAALIYYQQGIRDQEEIANRTDATIKLANVSRQSAEEVSSQMTAIWNNFYDGSKSLEYYADVITALGATTASSSEEIAGGMQKFAAVAETVGLSYEYAASALATIVATTRQSEDTVGTGLRTIFSRLEGLKLGDTLEDGTDLNKYSAALKTVGVDILDTTGNLKDMDTILDETAARWDQLDKAQQVAFATTVGGVRQYTNLIALLDNWDQMQKNVLTAKDSEGTLEQQAQIYAQSWEAAQRRVKAAMEDIYDSLLDEKFFIGLNNGLEVALKGVGNFLDSIDGVKGLLVGLGSIIMGFMANKLTPALNNVRQNLSVIFLGAQTEAQKTAGIMISKIEEQRKALQQNGAISTGEIQRLTNSEQLISVRTKLMSVTRDLTEAERNKAEFDINGIVNEQQKVQVIADTVTKLAEQDSEYRELLQANELTANTQKQINKTIEEYNGLLDEVNEKTWDAMAKNQDAKVDALENEWDELAKALEKYTKDAERLSDVNNTLTQGIVNIAQASMDGKGKVGQFSTTLGEIDKQAGGKLGNSFQKIINEMMQFRSSTKISEQAVEGFKDRIELLTKSLPRSVQNSKQFKEALQSIKNASVNSGKDIDEFAKKAQNLLNILNSTKITNGNFTEFLKAFSGDLGILIVENCSKATVEMNKLKEAQQQLQNLVNSFDVTHTVTGLEMITKTASSFGSLAMSINAFRSLIDTLNNEDLSFGERLTSILMSISMLVPSTISAFSNLAKIIPGITSAHTLFNTTLNSVGVNIKEVSASLVALESAEASDIAIKTIETKLTTALTLAYKTLGLQIDKETLNKMSSVLVSELKGKALTKENILMALHSEAMIAEIGEIDADTAAKIADTLATEGLGTAIKGMLGPVGLAIAAITALVTVLTLLADSQQKAKEEAVKMAEENAKTARELDEANKKQAEKVNDLFRAYFDANKALDDSETSKKALETATYNLADALDVELSAVQMLKGDYHELNKEIAEKAKYDALENLRENKKARDQTVETASFAGAALEGNQGNTEFVSLHEGIKGESSNFYLAPEHGKTVLNEGAIKDFTSFFSGYFANAGLEEGKDYVVSSSGYGMNPALALFGENKEEDLKIFYESIDEYINYITSQDYLEKYNLKATDITSSDIYKNLIEIKKELSDYYDKLFKIEENNDEYLENFISAVVTANTYDLDQLDSIDQYEELKNNILREIESNLISEGIEYDSDYLNTLVDEYLAKMDLISQKTINVSKGIKEITKSGKFNEDQVNQLIEKYGTDIVFQLHFDTAKDINELEKEADILQGIANNKEIKLKVDTILNAKKNLKKNMSIEDYQKFQTESGINWGQTDEFGNQIISYQEFLLKSYEEQQQYLDNLNNSYREYLDNNRETTINDLNERKESLLSEIQGYKDLDLSGNFLSDLNSAATKSGYTGDWVDDYIDPFYEKLSKSLGNIDLSDANAAKEELDSILTDLYEEFELTDTSFQNSVKDSAETWLEGLLQISDKEEQILYIEQQLINISNEGLELDVYAILHKKELQEEINKIANGEIEIGATISLEQYNILKDLGVENLENYLHLMADGTYKLVSEAEQFSKAVKNAQLNNNRDIIGSLKNTSQYNNAQNDLRSNTGQQLSENAINSSSLTQTKVMADYSSNKNYGIEEKQQIVDMMSQSGLQDVSTFTTENGQLKTDEESLKLFDKAWLEFSNTIKTATLNLTENAESLLELRENLDLNLITAIEYNNALGLVALNELNAATNMAEFNAAIMDATGAGVDLLYDNIANKLIELASQYDNTNLEIAQFNEALVAQREAFVSGDEAAMQAAANAVQEAERVLRASTAIGEAAKQYSLNAKDVETQAKQLSKAYGYDAESAARLAIANQRMNKAVSTLHENFSDWNKTLKSSSRTSKDYAEALNNLRETTADLVGAIDEDAISLEFFDDTTESGQKHLKLLEQAANGSEQAINLLGLAVAQDTINTLELSDVIASLNDGLYSIQDTSGTIFEFVESDFDNWKKTILNGITELETAVEDGSITAGDKVNSMGADWAEALNNMAAATGMSVAEMNALLNQLGVQAQVEVKNVEQDMEVPVYAEVAEPTEVTVYDEKVNDDGTVTQVPNKKHTWQHYTIPNGTKTVRGIVQVAQIKTEGGDTESPSVTYTGTSGSGNTSRGGGGGISPNSTAGKGSGGKGGGGGSGGKKETKEKKDPTEEKERYHLINQQIERQTNLLDRLSKNKDRAFGPQKQQYYAKELKSLKDMGKMYEEHLRQSTDYLASDKAVMQQWGAIISDKDNSILNYDALVQAQVDAYNAAVDRYNNSAQEDADKEALEAAEKAYEQFLDDLKQYEDTVKQHEEDLNNYIDNIIQQYDTMKEKTAEAIEFRIEYDDDVLDFLDKLLDRLDSWNGSMYNAVDIMGKLNEQTGALVNKNKDLETGLHETLEHYLMDYKEYDKDGNLLFQTGLSYDQSNAFIDRFMNNQLTSDDIEFLSHLPAEEREAVKDLVSQLTDNADAIIENAQAVVDNVKKQFDDAKEEMDEASKPFERASEAFQNYADIIDIVGRDYLGVSDEIAKGLRQAEIDNAYFATVAAKAELESLAQQRDAVRDEMNKALADGNEELAEKYRDVLKEMDDEVQSATETFHEKWQEQLQSVYEQMTATFEDIKKKSLDALTGPEGSPWSALKDQADYAKTAAEEYLPEYEKIYELSKLNRDINKSIDDTDNVKNKKALRDLQKEINKLAEENKEVSQYEIDNARKKYELELARLELEEAKNVKDIVRLSKDSEGNWSYIYTADEADVADAEQNYEDKLYALQQANADYINSLQDEWLTFTEDYMDKRIEIESDMTLQEEERKERLDALANYYADHERYLTEQLETAVDNNKDLYDDDWRWYRDYTKAKANLDTENAVEMAENNIYRLGNEKEFVTDWNDTFLGTQTAFETFEEFENNTTTVTEDFVNQMDQEVVNFEQNTQRAMESAGTSVNKFAEDMMDDVENTILPESEAAKDKIVEMGDAAVEVMDNLIDQADSWRDQYNDIMDAIIEKNELVIESINKVNGALSLLETENIGHDANEAGEGEVPENAIGSTGAGGPGDNGAGISPGGHEINEDSFRKIAAAIWVWNGAHAGWYTGADRRNRLIEKLGEAGANRVQQIINQEHDNLAFAYDWNALRNYFYSTFESGGYTGEWGNGGKFAMLHQKELVLNASDTENILGAVEMIRSISKSIDLNAMASQFAIGNLHAANANYGGNQLDQNVTITAEFPNATDRNEINEAFKMLINEASQYANRKNF